MKLLPLDYAVRNLGRSRARLIGSVITAVSIIVHASLLTMLAANAFAQNAVVDKDAAPAAEQAASADETEKSKPAPPPGEEVMAPTKHGLRMTPDLSRALAKSWIHGTIGESVDLTPEQTREWGAKLGDRTYRMSKENPDLTRNFFENMIETAMNHMNDKKMSPEEAQKFAQRFLPALPNWHDFMHGAIDDAHSILTEDQFNEAKRRIDARERQVDKIGETMQRWSRGEYKEEDGSLENVFSRLGRDIDELSSEDEKIKPQVIRARQRSRWEVMRVGPLEWSRFVTMARTTLKFTPEQAAKADQLLKEYQLKANAIMTPQWRKQVRDNRAQMQLRWELKEKQPLGPWLFHLDREYEALTQPITSLGKELYAKVLGLASDEQRAAAVEEFAKKVEQHGLTMSDADRTMLLGTLK